MSQRRVRDTARDASETGLRLVKDGLATVAVLTQHIPTRAERPCACGCGGCFVPTNNAHKYLKGHRHLRWLEDKKTATFALVQALFWVYGGYNDAGAERIAQDTVDFYFNARCAILERSGWKYSSEKKTWKYGK